jgi:A/G-specific adenine glycosylase
MKPSFTKALMDWHSSKNTRIMPWKGEKDPYKIWLSEIILQQTRVEQGRDYYNRFIKVFPTIQDLANAPDQIVFKLWEGLGYYNRCRNLIHTARTITAEFGGQFPDTYDEIIKLKGIGPYTASAITSFAFGLPYAVVDGNVMRVLSRVFAVTDPIDSKTGIQKLNALAKELLDLDYPGIYNQAIMDFGAVICKPAAPLCNSCPVQNICKAFKKGMVEKLPIKATKIARRKRWFYYFLVEKKGQVLIRQRVEKDIWQDLNEFILEETPRKQTTEKLLKAPSILAITKGEAFQVSDISMEYRQLLTHQEIHGRFIHIKVNESPAIPPGFHWVKWTALKKIPFPKYILSYLGKKR